MENGKIFCGLTVLSEFAVSQSAHYSVYGIVSVWKDSSQRWKFAIFFLL